MVWQPRVDHGQKHDPGDEIIVQRDLTIKGPLQKQYSWRRIGLGFRDGTDWKHLSSIDWRTSDRGAFLFIAVDVDPRTFAAACQFGYHGDFIGYVAKMIKYCSEATGLCSPLNSSRLSGPRNDTANRIEGTDGIGQTIYFPHNIYGMLKKRSDLIRIAKIRRKNSAFLWLSSPFPRAARIGARQPEAGLLSWLF